jgi:hypothetical protein
MDLIDHNLYYPNHLHLFHSHLQNLQLVLDLINHPLLINALNAYYLLKIAHTSLNHPHRSHHYKNYHRYHPQFVMVSFKKIVFFVILIIFNSTSTIVISIAVHIHHHPPLPRLHHPHPFIH